MSNTAECLDQSFDKMLEKFTGFMESFTPEEKEIAEKWIEKLKSSDSCVNEMKIRNEIMGYLNQCSAEGKFDAQPFNTIPPTKDPIFVQRWMLPGNYEFCCMEVEDDEKHEYLKDMFSLVDDHGEFFSTLPVPKNGIFCVAIMTPIHGEGSKAANMTGGGTAYDNYCY